MGLALSVLHYDTTGHLELKLYFRRRMERKFTVPLHYEASEPPVSANALLR